MKIKTNRRYKRVKKLHVKTVKQCSMCGKKFDLFDEQENFSLHQKVGYGSHYDGCQIDLQLCCRCFDRVFDTVVPMCKTSPVTDPSDWKWPDEA